MSPEPSNLAATWPKRSLQRIMCAVYRVFHKPLLDPQIGVVEAIAAPSMIRIEFSGKGGHGGGMPMKQRCACAVPAAATTVFTGHAQRGSTLSQKVGICAAHKAASGIRNCELTDAALGQYPQRDARMTRAALYLMHRNDPSMAASELALAIEKAALATGVHTCSLFPSEDHSRVAEAMQKDHLRSRSAAVVDPAYPTVARLASLFDAVHPLMSVNE